MYKKAGRAYELATSTLYYNTTTTMYLFL